MTNPPPLRRVSYAISIWVERQADLSPQWRGALETQGGQRFGFGTLDELNYLLCELGGWIDPPQWSYPDHQGG